MTVRYTTVVGFETAKNLLGAVGKGIMGGDINVNLATIVILKFIIKGIIDFKDKYIKHSLPFIAQQLSDREAGVGTRGNIRVDLLFQKNL